MTKRLFLKLAILMLFTTSCILNLFNEDYPFAKWVVEKINDGTADYGLDGYFESDKGEGERVVAKFRFSNNLKYNHAKYEGKTVEIRKCEISAVKDSIVDWEIVMYEKRDNS